MARAIIRTPDKEARRFTGWESAGGVWECRGNELDIKYVRGVALLLFSLRLFPPSVVWFVKHDLCEFSCVDKHEVYSAVCKCRGEEWFLIATCNCDDLREGVDERKLPCYGECVRFVKCMLLIACPVGGRQ